MNVSTSILNGLAATIAHVKHYLRLNEENDRISHQLHLQEVNAQAANWLKEPPHCPKHTDKPMYQLLMETPEHRKGDWMCHECADQIRFARAEQKPKSWSASPTYTSGSVILAINAQEQAYKQEFISRIAMERIPTLPKSTGEIPQVVKEMLPQANIPTLPPPHATNPLPARGIVYANTPFNDDDATEMRPAIRLPRTLQPVKTGDLRVEVLLDVLAQPTSPHQTGEQEKLPAKIEDGAFLL
jgi:hypothetical protein